MIGRYKRYDEYNDSGIKWLGKIPKEWIVSKFGYVKTVLTDYTANGSFADLKKNVAYLDSPSYARLVRLTDLRMNLNNSNGVWIDKDAYSYLSKSALFGGEFLLANVGAHAGLFYQMPDFKGNASLAPNMFMAKFDGSKIVREFMAYVGQSSCVNKQLRLYATCSSAQPKLNKDDFKSVRFTYPSMFEQKKIANFLDHETAKIDTLIEKQQQLIQLLKEKRQAVISHAVTKGLNPDVPMKDSGVEWLREVPAHWDVVMLGKKIQLQRGVDITKDQQKEDGEIPVVSSGGILSFHNKSFCRGPGVLVGRKGTAGKVHYIDKNYWPHDTTLYIKNFGGNNCRYVYYKLISMQLDSYDTGSANPTLNRNVVHPVKVSWPPVPEQINIVSYLKAFEANSEIMAERAEQVIALLRERRTALISAAVTGKIDVRNWKTPEQNQTVKEKAA